MGQQTDISETSLHPSLRPEQQEEGYKRTTLDEYLWEISHWQDPIRHNLEEETTRNTVS